MYAYGAVSKFEHKRGVNGQGANNDLAEAALHGYDFINLSIKRYSEKGWSITRRYGTQTIGDDYTKSIFAQNETRHMNVWKRVAFKISWKSIKSMVCKQEIQRIMKS